MSGRLLCFGGAGRTLRGTGIVGRLLGQAADFSAREPSARNPDENPHDRLTEHGSISPQLQEHRNAFKDCLARGRVLIADMQRVGAVTRWAGIWICSFESCIG